MAVAVNQAILAVIQGYQIMFDEDDVEEVHNIIKTKYFSEFIIPHLPDHQFKQHFRMDPTTFEELLKKLQVVSKKNVQYGHPEVRLEKQVFITLWCLANNECFRSISERFNVTKSTCWSILYRTCTRILDVNQQFKIIAWPSQQRAINIMEGFEATNGFPGVIGAIDGSHISINAPKEHHNSYFNRKQFHSVLLQGVCDHRKIFTHVYAGEPGSLHDNRMFEKSDLYESLTSGEFKLYFNSFILGDLAYRLNQYIMVGFKDNGNLTNQQKRFNYLLSQVRVCIETAFALLKGRFRRLKHMDTVRLDLICLLIITACVLHNICILNGDSAEELFNVVEEMNEERLNLNNEPFWQAGQRQGRKNQLASIRRNDLMNQLIPPA